MFESFRNKFYSIVKDGISLNSIRKSSESGSSSSPKLSSKFDNVNYNVGCDLLEKYQKEWEQIHSLTEENAKNAVKVDETITTIQDGVQKRLTDISDLNISLSNIPSIVATIQSCVDQVKDLGRQAKAVEDDLFLLENLIDVLDLQEMQLEHRFEMALYKEKKLANLELVRVELAKNHAANMVKHEMGLKRIQQERQAAFQEAFQSDLQQYKQAGSIPKVEKKSAEKSLSLEDIQLDTEDTQALDDFLSK